MIFRISLVFAKLASLMAVVCSGIMVSAFMAYGATPLRVAMLTWRGETLAEQGFRAELADNGCPVEYFHWDAGQDSAKLGSFLRAEFDPDKFDYVYTFGTSCSVRVHKALQGRVPHIYSLVFYPRESGLAVSMGCGGRANLAGVSHHIPVSVQIRMAVRLLGCSRLGLLFNPREPNSIIQKKDVEAFAAEIGLDLKTFRVAPGSDYLECFLTTMEEGCEDIDALYLPSDSYLCSKVQEIVDSCVRAGIPVIGSNDQLVRDGALFGVVVDYEHMGRMAARQLLAHRNGYPLKDMPVGVADKSDIRLGVNRSTMQRMEFSLPESLEMAVRFY